jgi:glycerol-3-phosphate O-acyltransferase
VDSSFDEIFDQNLAFLVRVRALVREGDRIRPGADAATLAFLAEFVRPFLEAYRVAASTALERLGAPGGASPDRRALLAAAMERGLAAFLAGAVALRESVSKATLENAIEWLVSGSLLTDDGGRLALADRDGVRAIVDGIAPYLAL